MGSAKAGDDVVGITEVVQAKVEFKKFRELWDAKSTHPSGLWSHPFSVDAWQFRVELSENQSKLGFVSLRLKIVSKALVPLKLSDWVTECNGVPDLKKISGKKLWFKPSWCAWEDRDDFSLSWTHTEYCPIEHLFVAADRCDGKLMFTMTLTMSRPYNLPDFQHCLIDRPGREAWSQSCLVVLKVNEESEISMPKEVLCAHSPVFRAALNSEMVEGSTNTINVSDASLQALQDLCDCLFHGGLPSSICTGWERLKDLAEVAMKYQITELVDACTFYLSVAMSHSNIGEILMTADRHGMLKLLKSGVYFVLRQKSTLEALRSLDDYRLLSGDLMRILFSHMPDKGVPEKCAGDPPLNLQWADVPLEFPEGTSWENLSSEEVRRACFERCLGTSGTVAELIALLAQASSDGAPEESPTKKQRTSAAE